MVQRGDVVLLGLTAGVTGSLVGGMMLGIGMNLVIAGVNAGWLLLLPAAPAGGIAGWVLGRRLARQLDG